MSPADPLLSPVPPHLCLGWAPCQDTGPSDLCCLVLLLICVPVCSPQSQLGYELLESRDHKRPSFPAPEPSTELALNNICPSNEMCGLARGFTFGHLSTQASDGPILTEIRTFQEVAS